MANHISTSASDGNSDGRYGGRSIGEIPKSSVFTDNLSADPLFPTPASSYKASRSELGPRLVRNALYTFVRPEEKPGAKLVAVSERAMKDIGLAPGEEKTEEFQAMMAGNKILWDPETEKGIYPWAQCYGGGYSPLY
jgi:serine/tyrosine/threonine adenylyltransferase